MKTQDISYRVDEKTFTGYLAFDPARSGTRPGVLVCHQGNGLSDHAKERARMLAERGYVAFALDMYGEVATSQAQAMAWLTHLMQNPEVMRKRANAGLEQLKAQPNVDRRRLAAIGYCFGGAVVLELARSVPEIACVVAFHPGFTTLPEKDDRKVHAKVMVCTGVEDPLIPPDARQRFIDLMVAAGADWQLIVYGNAGHSFTDKTVGALGIKGFDYHELADKRSWSAMRNLFEETLGPV